ncbi:MAG: GTPase HflX [Planctomycetota bacterium]
MRTSLTVHREKAFLVRGLFPGDDAPDSLGELAALAETAGAVVVGSATQRRSRIDSAFYIGRGKVEEIKTLAGEQDADVVIFDHELAPAQMRNLEKVLVLKVVDRSELILDIFATHARTEEARLQVELAQLEYLLPRLRRMWTHLERIEGGIGTRGPGEKQIEMDRRLARNRISMLRKNLDRLVSVRERQVASRRERYRVSLVGYTNAGKSTLMRRLTGVSTVVEDKLFSTLDTLTRPWRPASGVEVLLSDTVGFIRNLPHHLVASFRATLEEARTADLLLHVVDAASPWREKTIATVDAVLAEIGCAGTSRLRVYNKADRIPDPVERRGLALGDRAGVVCSALTGEGVEVLADAVLGAVEAGAVEVDVTCPLAAGDVIALAERAGRVIGRTIEGDTITLQVRMPVAAAESLRHRGISVRPRAREAAHGRNEAVS